MGETPGETFGKEGEANELSPRLLSGLPTGMSCMYVPPGDVVKDSAPKLLSGLPPGILSTNCGVHRGVTLADGGSLGKVGKPVIGATGICPALPEDRALKTRGLLRSFCCCCCCC